MSIEYNKTSGPITAHELVAIDFLGRAQLLPPNPLTPDALLQAVRDLPVRQRTLLRLELGRVPDEGAGVVEATAL